MLPYQRSFDQNTVPKVLLWPAITLADRILKFGNRNVLAVAFKTEIGLACVLSSTELKWSSNQSKKRIEN